MYKRTLENTIKQASDAFPVLLITGPRQVGKTTLLKLCASSKRQYVTLDNLEDLALARQDPKLFLQTYKIPLIIDEIQYAPNLLRHIKMAVDQSKEKGSYWLTGSQKFELMKGVTESLAGRIAILDLLGLSQQEIHHQGKQSPFLPSLSWLDEEYGKSTSIEDSYQSIWQGSFPEVIGLSAENRDIFYRSYLQTYLQRDVKDILNISDNLLFYQFLKSLAARTGQQLNYNSLSKETGVDSKTIKSWLSVLQASGIVYLLPAYANNLHKRISKSPKIYFLDTGLCCHLTHWSTPESLQSGIMSGAILETYVFSEILKSYWHNGISPNIYYYRDQSQHEIDFIIEKGNTLHPIEIKKTSSPSLTKAHFSALQKTKKNIGTGAIICFIETIKPLNKDILAIPISYI